MHDPPLILSRTAAAIIKYSSYHKALYGMGGAFALALILIFFFMPESVFHREVLNIHIGESAVSFFLRFKRWLDYNLL